MTAPHLPAKRDVRRAFGAAASTYEEHAFLQREIAGRLLERLDYIKFDARRVLDLGCGTGVVAHKLHTKFPDAQVIGLDLTVEMLRHAAAASMPSGWARLAAPFRRTRPAYVCADAESLPLAAESLDAIVSNLTLQWCDVQAVAREAVRTLKPGGVFLFTTFGPDTLQELRAAFRAADEAVHVNRFVDMHDIGDMLVAAGFVDPVMDREIVTLTYPDLKKLMTELKGIGAHNVLPDRSRGLMGKTRWQRMAAAYESYRLDGRLPATYEVVYGHAWIPERKKQSATDGVQSISLGEFKRMVGRG